MKAKIKYQDVRAGMIKLFVQDFVQTNHLEYYYLKPEFMPELYSKLRTNLDSGLIGSFRFKTKLSHFIVDAFGVLTFTVMYDTTELVEGEAVINEVEFQFKSVIDVGTTIKISTSTN